MTARRRAWLAFVLALAAAAWRGPVVSAAEEPPPVSGPSAALPSPLYEFRADHDPDGTGKFFLGREIAQVMGHQGADWLERPEREAEEAPDQVVAALRLKPGEVVADIGAGTGYFTWRLAKAVGPAGRVYAVDVQREMLALLERNLNRRGISNVVSVLGSAKDPRLPPASIDLALMVDVYHEFEFPYEMLRAICDRLKPGGRVVFVEYRAEDAAVPIKAVHKMTEAQVRREAGLHPLEWVETVRTLPWQHLVVFRKTRSPLDTERRRVSTSAPADPRNQTRP